MSNSLDENLDDSQADEAEQQAAASDEGSNEPDPELAGTFRIDLSIPPKADLHIKAVFEVNGTNLSGTLSYVGQVFPVTGGHATKDGFEFELNIGIFGFHINAQAKGKRDGDKISGDSVTSFGTFDFIGEKEE
ncbi:MAG: hypothetical protein LUB61_05875 [Eggerthellaceae bacterium]|nr:hypothetical protein [Eggerthellaceae bacterium]